MGFKKPRLGLQLLQAAEDPTFFDQVHVIFGGTGAVGGATALHLVSFFEEAARRRPEAAAGRSPRIVVTGRTKQEVRQFTSLLFGIQQRDHGERPRHLAGRGYRTAGGVTVELQIFGVDPAIPELKNFGRRDAEGRQEAVRALLDHGGLGPDAPAAARAQLLDDAIAERVGTPFSDFLAAYRAGKTAEGELDGGLPGGGRRFRSVIVGIPLASVATYKLGDLEAAAPAFGIEPGSERMEELKAHYLAAIRDDLAHVADELAQEVLAAHTTAVGGMYDEQGDGERVIRLGFAHSALGDKLRQKQLFAETLSELYAERGIKMLVTAAAIGVDAVLMGKAPPINGAVRGALAGAAADGNPVVPEPDLSNGVVRSYPPLHLALLRESPERVSFSHGMPIIMDYVLKSGENGFFTVSNTDALYRVMRVTSSSELGLTLARTAVFGDDPRCPSFVDNVCYYTETDNSRQVFDLLSQPPLARAQLAGLGVKALQDLGSAKHQAEMHLLGLLILLHRLKTLDLDAIPAGVDLQSFDPRAFFEEHSRELTLDRAASFRPDLLAAELTALAAAREVSDLEALQSFYQPDPRRQEAAHRIFQAVLRTVWSIPSLGSPILYDKDGERRVVCGPYAAPLDRVVTHRDRLGAFLRERYATLGGQLDQGDDPSHAHDSAFQRFVEMHIANNGFIDLRPVAVLVTARSAAENLDGKVQLFREEEPFLEALAALPPYSYFATSGLLALSVRLRGLARQAHQLDLRFGTANEYRTHFRFDDRGRPLLVPGIVEAFRMVSEGLSKNTGHDRLDGRWGYGVRPASAARD
jgi:hypothetical protein